MTTAPTPLNVDILTIPEIAVLADVKVGSAERWKIRRDQAMALPEKDRPKSVLFPDPDDYVGGAPVWRLERVTEWLLDTGRPCHVVRWRKAKDLGEFRRK